jgi:saccharopine dehydrogenase-like NADP-dependent oxidoreductase
LKKAGGNLGVHVLKTFLNSPYKVSILTPKESTSKFPEGIPVFRADYSDINQVKSAMEDQDVVISMVAVFATGGQQILVDAAIAAGVERVFPSEFRPPSRDENLPPCTRPYHLKWLRSTTSNLRSPKYLDQLLFQVISLTGL